MGLVSLLQKQIEHQAQMACQERNQGLPIEHGKACFETLANGVAFIKQHYLLDSNQCSYSSSVAKVIWDEKQQYWLFFVPHPQDKHHWRPYPTLASSAELSLIMREVTRDPLALIWST